MCSNFEKKISGTFLCGHSVVVVVVVVVAAAAVVVVDYTAPDSVTQ